jgi:DHA1 family bicyclomycin/chloramphenicol resistance-like MFS transporter
MTTTATRPTLTPLLLAVLALLSSFTPLSIDMYLPALPVIAVDLRGTAGDIQLTLSAFMIAFGAGQVFYGPAGDRFGRRPVILSGLFVYILTSIGCAFAVEAGHLVVLRFLQGLAACGGVVLARTMVRDLAERDQAARAMSLMMACTSIAPMLAPLIGGQILWYAGWRAIFWTLAGIGVLALGVASLRLPETLRPEYRQPLVLSHVLKRFGELFRHRAFMGYAFTGSFQFAALFSFLSGSPFVFIERYGVAPRAYGLIFGSMVVFMTLGSLLNARFAPVFGAARILRYAVIVPYWCWA